MPLLRGPVHAAAPTRCQLACSGFKTRDQGRDGLFVMPAAGGRADPPARPVTLTVLVSDVLQRPPFGQGLGGGVEAAQQRQERYLHHDPESGSDGQAQ